MDSTHNLQEKIDFLAQYYMKGFGNYLTGILVEADLYVTFDQKEARREHAYETLAHIEEKYRGIPEGQHEVFDNILVILPLYRRTVDKAFENNAWAVDAIKGLNLQIMHYARQYYEELVATVDRFREDEPAYRLFIHHGEFVYEF